MKRGEAAPTRAYVLRDRNGEPIAVVRDCQNPAQAVRAYLHREGLTARVASAEDALDALACGAAVFSADDPTAGVPAAFEQQVATLAAALHGMDEPAPVVLPEPAVEPTQAELEAADFAHDAAREDRVFGRSR